jgi:beta-glucanase (GH16 family)
MSRTPATVLLASLGLALAASTGSAQEPFQGFGDTTLASADFTPPAAPVNLIWTHVDMTVTMSWGASTDDVGVVAYDFYYGSYFIGSTSETLATLIGFQPSTPYNFTVRARDAAGNVSAASNQITVLLSPPQDTTPPAAPSNLTALNVTTSSVTLSWTASTDNVGVAGYSVYQGSTLVASPTGTGADVSGLAARTTYTFTVRARDAAGNVSAASSAATVTTASSTGPFTLAWQDDFNSFDSSRWQLMTHSWDGNLAQFSTSNTRFSGGILSLLLTSQPSDSAKPFRGVEMRSLSTLTYGKIETRARYARGSGVVSATVLIYTPWPADNWNELDIEYLGFNPNSIQFNEMVYLGTPPTPPVTTSVTPTQYPQVTSLGFDASADFHVYSIEWTPQAATFLVDGVVKHTWSQEIGRMKLPQNILLTIWASNSASWAGPIQSSTAPTQADFDWIKVYNYTP